MGIRISLISNIVFEPYFRTYIPKAFLPLDSDVQLTFILCEEVCKRQYELKNSKMIVVCLNFNELYPDISDDILSEKIFYNNISEDLTEKCRRLYLSIKTYSDARIVWFGFEDYYLNLDSVFGTVPILNGMVDGINQRIVDIITGDVYIDLKHLIAGIGINSAYSRKGKYRWNAPYSKYLMALMADEVYKQFLIYIGQTKKCLVLDCDNVLWGGILSEDGIEGIHLSRSGIGGVYRDFQLFLKELYYHGVILAVCSKNNLTDVLQVFNEHREMVLKEKNISCFTVNWDNKSLNIKRIAEYLNIGLDSIVFVDDLPAEIECVKSVLPEVTCIQFDKYMDYGAFACFNLKYRYDSEDAERRTQTYKANSLREDLKAASVTHEEYVQSLKVVVDIHQALPIEFNRVSELTQRTNKCTNGCRYTIKDIKERIKIPNGALYSVSVSDRFSDLGLVGAMEIEDARLCLFSLSCRAFGRDVEQAMINFLLSHHQLKSFDFSSTGKNDELKNILTNSISNNT